MKPQAASRKVIVQRYIASHGKTTKNGISVKIEHEDSTRIVIFGAAISPSRQISTYTLCQISRTCTLI